MRLRAAMAQGKHFASSSVGWEIYDLDIFVLPSRTVGNWHLCLTFERETVTGLYFRVCASNQRHLKRADVVMQWAREGWEKWRVRDIRVAKIESINTWHGTSFRNILTVVIYNHVQQSHYLTKGIAIFPAT